MNQPVGCLQNKDLRPKTEDPKTKTSFFYRPIKLDQRFSSDTN